MLKDLRVGWRQFSADPGYTAVIMLGLSVAIAGCYLVAQVVFNEVLPDPDVPDPGQVVNIEFRGNIPGQSDDWFDQAPFVFGTTLRQAGAPVSAIARVTGSVLAVHAGALAPRLGVVFADPELVDVLGLRVRAGDLRDALRRPDAVGLSESAARRLFPAGGAMGATVLVRGHALVVAALVADRVRSDGDARDVYTSFDSPLSPVDDFTRQSWYSMAGKVLARVAPGFTPRDVGAAAQALFDDGPGARSVPAEWTAHGRKGAFLRATPMTRQYLEGGRNGRAHLLLLLSLGGGAALMLGLAVANYINLTSVRTLARAREIAVRKTLGASPWRLSAQFMVESALAAGVAALAGLLLAWWLAPAIGQLLGLGLDEQLFSPARLALLAAGALLLGAITGLYPARIALTVNCIAALAGRSHDEGTMGRGLRRAMTTLQFVVALVIASGAGAMLWQNRYVASLAHGVRTEGLLGVDLPEGYSGKLDAIHLAFREALSHEPGVDASAWSLDVPGRGQARLTDAVGRRAGGATINVSFVPVDTAYFGVYGIDLLAGSLREPPPVPPDTPAAPADAAGQAPGPEKLVVLDATAARALGFASPQAAVDQVILGGGDDMTLGHDPMRIVAVARDIRLEDAHQPPEPHLFQLSRHAQATLTLKGPRMDLLRQAVDRVGPRFYPEDPLWPVSVEEAMATPYRNEHRLAQMAGVTTGLTLLLSAFGVYALAAYTVRRSAREIVVRKLYGASSARIAAQLAREFAPLLAVAACVGLPLAAWLSHAWLANFIERSPAVFLALPLALLALVGMTALAAARHVLIAMNMRPTLALRG